jgi:tRNA-specific 2-thiouridylase
VKIAVAMSGGVDSAVAAALLKEAGHEVTGLTMRVTDDTSPAIDAADIAARLGIPHRAIDLHEIFAEKVIDDFCGEYGRGRTPNPCVLCNRYIKFGALWEEAKKAGAETLATGHYARIEKNTAGRYLLKKGQDKTKDQSYFLGQLTQEQLGRTLFPLGDLTKDEVRKITKELGLPVTSRRDSQEICFVPDGDIVGFIRANRPEAERPGIIRDETGSAIGRHRGIAAYTVGQRRGLGIAGDESLYVTAIAVAENAVIVGNKESTYGTELIAGGLNWIAIESPKNPLRLKARIRYRHAEAEAIITPQDGNALVEFTSAQSAITPGQAIIFYDGDKVVGAGTIIKRTR